MDTMTQIQLKCVVHAKDVASLLPTGEVFQHEEGTQQWLEECTKVVPSLAILKSDDGIQHLRAKTNAKKKKKKKKK